MICEIKVGAGAQYSNHPVSIAIDERHAHILVADLMASDSRSYNIHIFDGENFNNLATIAVSHDIGPDGVQSIAYSNHLNHIFALGAYQIQVFDGDNFSLLTTVNFKQLSPHKCPLGLYGGAVVDEKHDWLIISEFHSCVNVLDAKTFSDVGLIGDPDKEGSDNAHFHIPSGMAIDPTNNNLLIVDSLNSRVQAFDTDSPEHSFQYVGTLDAGIYLLSNIVIGGNHVFVATDGARREDGSITLFGPLTSGKDDGVPR